MLANDNFRLPNKLQGIGGWLLFFVIFFVFYRLVDLTYYAGYISTFFRNIHSSGDFNTIDAYISYFSLFMIILTVGIFYGIFLKKKFTINAIVFYLGLIITLNLLINFLTGNDIFNKDAVQNILYGCIWIPYFYFSERVKATFIN